MTRQIKFRAWVESVSKMLDWEYLKYKSDIGAVISGGYDGYHPMQFTGLLDKNGKEIYEGDVVQYVDTFKNYKGKNKIVVDMCTGCNWSITEWTIIGNIYENPELLNN